MQGVVVYEFNHKLWITVQYLLVGLKINRWMQKRDFDSIGGITFVVRS